MRGHKILDEVGEWGEVDIVEDDIREKRDKTVKREKVKWEKIPCLRGL